MVLSYKQIVINGYAEHHSQKTHYISYFRREAQIAKRDNFVEFVDFFNGCKVAITDYKREIEARYNNALTEYDFVLNQCYLALDRGEVINPKGEPIQDIVDNIEKIKKFIEKNGYKDNRDYLCRTTDTGIITRDIFDTQYVLYYSDIIQLESAVLQAEQELTEKVGEQRHKINVDANEVVNTKSVGRKINKSKSDESLTLSDIFDEISKYKTIMEILVNQKLIHSGTYIWKDETKGNKGYLASLIKNLHGKQYFKGNAKPTSKQIELICKNTFGWNVSDGTIKHTKPDDFDFSFIPPASTTD